MFLFFFLLIFFLRDRKACTWETSQQGPTNTSKQLEIIGVRSFETVHQAFTRETPTTFSFLLFIQVYAGRQPLATADRDLQLGFWEDKSSSSLKTVSRGASQGKVEAHHQDPALQDICACDMDTYGIDYVQYEALKKAIQSGDWIAAEEFLKRQPDAAAAKITKFGETALFVAVYTGHEHIVEKLVDLMSEEDLAIPNNAGNTALVEVISVGNYRMAACMLRKNNNLIRIRNYNAIPVNLAMGVGHMELARYLYSLTPLGDLMPESGIDGSTLCIQAIHNRSLDIALDLIRKCPRLVLALDSEGSSPLYALANVRNAFQSGDGLVFWKRWIYNYCIHIEPASAINETRLDIQSLEKGQSDKVKIIRSGIHIEPASAINETCLDIQSLEKGQSDKVKIIKSVKALLRQLVSNLRNFLGIKGLYEMKLVDVQAHELLDHMCKEVSISPTTDTIKNAVFRSIEMGNFEFVFRMVKAKSSLIRSRDEDGMSIFAFATLHRQAKIFSLIYGLPLKNVMASWCDQKNNIILHMTGRTEASIQLNQIQGAALKMQRELQWFKGPMNFKGANESEKKNGILHRSKGTTSFPLKSPLSQSVALPPGITPLSSGAHPLFSGELFGHRRLSVPCSPSRNQSLALPPGITPFSSGAHPLFSGEFFGHRRLSIPRSPSRNHPLSPSALTLSPPASSSTTDEAIPPSLPGSLKTEQGIPKQNKDSQNRGPKSIKKRSQRKIPEILSY
ncbi:hypothetical protein FH972_008590 [Carpinus fangiana]|uniref:Uncharacterized protein n=1 Tax=Carpinus fangiana TaxID=176857 RepID=A0A5N6R292_9ROSI|nr:hypothetical protein FH972_008590 [Carpinus fangiana]